MGLLDDLKKQADMVKSQRLSQKAILEESIKLVEAKMHQTSLYLNDLLKQLVVLKPVNPTKGSCRRCAPAYGLVVDLLRGPHASADDAEAPYLRSISSIL